MVMLAVKTAIMGCCENKEAAKLEALPISKKEDIKPSRTGFLQNKEMISINEENRRTNPQTTKILSVLFRTASTNFKGCCCRLLWMDTDGAFCLGEERAKQIPHKSAEIIWIVYRRMPNRTEPNREPPTPAMTKAGPVLLQKQMTFSVSDKVSFLLLYRSAAIFMPIGKPQTAPKKNGMMADEGMPNRF